MTGVIRQPSLPGTLLRCMTSGHKYCIEFVLPFHDKTQKFIVVVVSRTVTLHTNQWSVLFLTLFSKLPLITTLLKLSGVRIPVRARDIYLLSNCTGVASRDKTAGVNHQPRPSADVMNKGSYTSVPPVCLYSMGREKLYGFFLYCVWDVSIGILF